MEAQLQFLPPASDTPEALDRVRQTLHVAGASTHRADVDLYVDRLSDLRRLATLPALGSGWELEKPVEEFMETVDESPLVEWVLTYPGPWEAWWFGRLDLLEIGRVLDSAGSSTAI